jgi:hypothetical protein
MCGRFTLTATPAALNDLFQLFDNVELVPHYNVAPTQNVLAVRLRQGTKELQAVRLRWGLVPSWADDPKIGYRMINARLDPAPIKPAFRSAFKHRHCLILADGFFEWKKIDAKRKQPYHIHMRDGRPFAFGRPPGHDAGRRLDRAGQLVPAVHFHPVAGKPTRFEQGPGTAGRRSRRDTDDRPSSRLQGAQR